MKSMQSFADIVSFTSIFAGLLPLLQYIVTRDIFFMQLLGGILITNTLVEVTKQLVGSQGWRARPAGASGCDLFCMGGPVGGAPGFPSGHMSAVTMYSTAVWLHTRTPWIGWSGVAWVGAMAWSRWVKHCHTPLQIIAGAGVGAFAAWALHYLPMASQ